MSELSPDAKRLIRTLRAHDRPPPGARSRVRARVEGRVGGVALATLLTTKSLTAFAKVAAALALVAVAVKVTHPRPVTAHPATAVGTRASTATHTPVTVSPVTPVVARVAPSTRVEVAPAAPPRVAVRRAPRPPTVRIESTVDARPTTSPTVAAPPVAVASIADEVRALQLVQSVCRAGDPRACLARLDAHARDFPLGALREEAQGMRALALCRAGEVEAARSVARALRAASPRSPMVSRLRGSCAGADE